MSEQYEITHFKTTAPSKFHVHIVIYLRVIRKEINSLGKRESTILATIPCIHSISHILYYYFLTNIIASCNVQKQV